ncbi:MAG: putative RNA methyltransferase [Pseudomonadota bacterium]
MTLFTCPICRHLLERDERRFVCEHSHSFDIARSGYVNLLPAHHRRSKQPGDSADMVSARRTFLNAGHYAPLAERIMESLSDQPGTHADLGCGEGYYANRMSEITDEIYGLDISKPAITACASTYKHIKVAVANVLHLPLAHGCFDSVSVIFAPFPEQVACLLKPQALVLRVTPGEHHLTELKSEIFEKPIPHRRGRTDYPDLTLARRHDLRYTMALDHDARSQLLAMTPMQYRMKRSLVSDARDSATRVESAGSTAVTAHFRLDIFRRD